MSLNLHISNTKEYGFKIWPYSVGNEAIFELIDEDLENGLKSIMALQNQNFINQGQLNMKFQTKEEELAYKQGWQDGRQHESDTLNAPKVNYGYTGLRAENSALRDSRMDARKVEDLSCSICKAHLYRTELINGVVYEHLEGVPCANMGKYIYRKFKLVNSE